MAETVQQDAALHQFVDAIARDTELRCGLSGGEKCHMTGPSTSSILNRNFSRDLPGVAAAPPCRVVISYAAFG